MNDILSICITVKNRSRVSWKGMDEVLTLLPNCIDSIGKLYSKQDRVEIVISDWNSTDWRLDEWMPKVCRNPYRIINIDKEGFSKGYGVNQAVANTMGDTVFLLDADMILKSRSIISIGMNIASKGGAYFPVPKYIVNKEGDYRYSCGVGNCIINKNVFNAVGGVPEYWRYGFEDSDFYKNIEKKGIKIGSGPNDDLLHPYHPQSLAFKEQFIDDDPEHDKQIQKRVEFYKKHKRKNENVTV